MSIFGKQPDTLTLDNYTVILPTTNDSSPEQGNVLHIKLIDNTNHLVYLEWSSKDEQTITTYEDVQIKNNLVMGDGTFNSVTSPGNNSGILKLLDNLNPALNITEGNNSYMKFITTNSSEGISIGNAIQNTTITQIGTGQVTFGGNVEANANLDITGNTSVTTFDSSGATSLATGGGIVDIASIGVMTTVKGNLNVDEAVTLDSTLDVTGNTSVTTFDSSGATSLATGGGIVDISSSGVMTTVKGNLNVDEAVTLDSTLDVTGNISTSSIHLTDDDSFISLGVDGVSRLTHTSDGLEITDSFIPSTNNNIDLGTNSLKFRDAFFDGTVTSDSFVGSLTGTASGLTPGVDNKITFANEIVAPNFSGTNTGDQDLNSILHTTSTGVSQGGVLSLNSDNTKFDISAGFGYIVDGHTDAENPISTKVTWAASSGHTPTYMTSHNATYIGIDVNGTIIQTHSLFSSTQRRNYIRFGLLVHPNRSFIFIVNNHPTINVEIGAQVQDILDVLGFRTVSGNMILPAQSTGMTICKKTGTCFKPGSNFDTLNTQPHFFESVEQSPITFRYRTSTGNEYPDTTIINPAIYDLDGEFTGMPSTATMASVQRVYMFQEGDIRIQPGQEFFTSLSLALDAVNSGVFVVEPNILSNGLYLASIAMTRDAGNMAAVTGAIFIPAQGTTANGSIPIASADYIQNQSLEAQLASSIWVSGNILTDTGFSGPFKHNKTTIVSSLSITDADAGVTLNLAASDPNSTSVVITLPPATGTGHRYTFIITALSTMTDAYKFVVDPGTSDKFHGFAIFHNGNTGESDTHKITTHSIISHNGTTTGGQIGDRIEFVDITPAIYQVMAHMSTPAGTNSDHPASSGASGA
jgi:hypothetical protein